MKKENCLYTVIVAIVFVASVIAVAVFYKVPTGSILANKMTLDLFENEIVRSASTDITEIKDLMDKPDYQNALEKTAKALKHSDMEIKELDDVSYVWADEGMRYEEETELQMNSELRWTYVYLLLKCGNNKEAKKQLKLYLKHEEYAAHVDEAKVLLASLK